MLCRILTYPNIIALTIVVTDTGIVTSSMAIVYENFL